MRSFARFVGIVMIIGLCLSLLVIPIVVFSFGMIRALSGGVAIKVIYTYQVATPDRYKSGRNEN